MTNKRKNINNVTEEIIVKRKRTNQEKADDLILNYICAHGKHFTTVQESKFKLSCGNVQLPGTKLIDADEKQTKHSVELLAIRRKTLAQRTESHCTTV